MKESFYIMFCLVNIFTKLIYRLWSHSLVRTVGFFPFFSRSELMRVWIYLKSWEWCGKLAIIYRFKQENPRDKLVPNPQDSWIWKSASCRVGIPHSPLRRGRAKNAKNDFVSHSADGCRRWTRTVRPRRPAGAPGSLSDLPKRTEEGWMTGHLCNYILMGSWFGFCRPQTRRYGIGTKVYNVLVQSEVLSNAVRMALCIECSPAVQEVLGSIPDWDASVSDARCRGCRWPLSSPYNNVHILAPLSHTHSQ
jgi:hypothetical protein